MARLLRGESDIFGIIKGQLSRLIKRALKRQNGVDGHAQNPAAFARNVMATLSRRGARKRFFCSIPATPAPTKFKIYSAKAALVLKSFAGAEIKMVPGLGEAVSETSARKTAADIMIEFLAEA